MILSQTGESRVNGYLFVLERSLRTFLPTDVVREAVREIESHLRERIATADAAPDERAALEKILAELGPPLRVAQAYSTERIIDEAVTTGRVVPMLRAIWHAAVTTGVGFVTALGLFVGYAIGVGLVMVAVLKPIFPANVGLWVDASGVPHAFGAMYPVPAGEHLVGSYWVVPISLLAGLAVLVFTHRLARWFLGWWQRRRALASPDRFVA